MNSTTLLGDGDGWILQQLDQYNSQQAGQYNNVFGWPDQPTQTNPLGTILLVGAGLVIGLMIFARD